MDGKVLLIPHVLNFKKNNYLTYIGVNLLPLCGSVASRLGPWICGQQVRLRGRIAWQRPWASLDYTCPVPQVTLHHSF